MPSMAQVAGISHERVKLVIRIQDCVVLKPVV